MMFKLELGFGFWRRRWRESRDPAEAGTPGSLVFCREIPQTTWPQMSSDFARRTAAALLDAMEYALTAEELARKDGLLQRFDPRAKVAGLTALIIAAAVAQK